MAGQIIKRGERNFLVRVYLGRDAEGKRKYENRTVRGTKKDAQAMLTRLLLAKDTGQVVEDPRKTLNEYLDEWLEAAVKPRVRGRTYREYAATLRRYVRPVLGAQRLISIRPVDVQDLYSGMQQQGRSGSVRLTHTLLKGALAQAVKWQMLNRNPADYVDLPKKKQTSKVRALSKDEAERFLGATKHSRWHVFFHLLVATGLRPSEALGLTWKDIDLAKGTLTVRHSLSWDKDVKRFVLQEPKTPLSRRTIPLPYGLVKLLSEHMTVQQEQGFGEMVFCSRTGNPPHQRTIVQEAFKPAIIKAGLNKATRLYDLRHTHATLLLLLGVQSKVVAERLGHSSSKITLDVYSHVLPNMQQEAAEKLDALLYSSEDNNLEAAVKN